MEIKDIDSVTIKTYIDCLNELTEDKLFDGLVGDGLFSEKIPPFLSSKSFLAKIKEEPNNNFDYDNKPRKFIRYDNIRNINIPRTLAIPHPIAYKCQCQIIKEYWQELKEYFENKTEKNPYKISRVHIRRLKNSSKIFEMNYKNFYIDDSPVQKLLIKKNYIVKADISNCFPSIYSHSIPWALVGKETSKNNRGDDKYYNLIDKSCSSLKDGETSGILIGPHASNIISEIVLVAIDEKLSEEYQYIRYIDDYTCYVESNEQAEKFLMSLSKELSKFNLTLNHKKTEILKLPLTSDAHWIRKIKAFPFTTDREMKFPEIKEFIDTLLDLMNKNEENSSILNYAIKTLSNKKMTDNAKKYFIDTIHHLVLIYPYLIHLLENNVFNVFDIDKSKIEEISQDIFKMGEDKNLYEAMSYAIYFSIKYDFIISNNLFEIINKSRDTILMLLAYLHDKTFSKACYGFNKSENGKKYKRLAEELKEDINEYWLFVYKVLSKDLLKDEWGKMKSEGISFIKKDFMDKAKIKEEENIRINKMMD